MIIWYIKCSQNKHLFLSLYVSKDLHFIDILIKDVLFFFFFFEKVHKRLSIVKFTHILETEIKVTELQKFLFVNNFSTN